MVLFVDLAERKPDIDQNSNEQDTISHKLLKLADDMYKKYSTIYKSILAYGNRIDFSWMAYFSHSGVEKIYCSITTHDVVDYYEINISDIQITIYSYKWQNYAYLRTKPISHGYVLQNNSEFIAMLSEFKIVLFDIMQDVFATLSDEFHVIYDDSPEYQYAKNCFMAAVDAVQIRKVI